MTTINGVTFNMVNLRPVAVHRNSVSEQPGSDTNFITDMGYDGLVLRLEGYEETLAAYDNVISEFMKSGEQTLVYRTGWQFKVYSVQLTPELIEGIVDNYFPYDLILYTSTPYRESTSETTRSKTITTNNQEWSADDSANDIDTSGSVDAVPDIVVTGGGEIYTEYSAPSTGPKGLAWDGSNIWSCDSVSNKIYKHNADMTVNTLYDSPDTSPSGLTWDGSNIWSCDFTSDKIYKHNADMTVNTTYNAPATSPSGLTWDGSNIWSCDDITDKIYKHNGDLTVNTSYDSPGSGVSGLAWDGTSIISCDLDDDKISEHNADMTVNSQYPSPYSAPWGLTWDGYRLWSCDNITHKIYKHAKYISNEGVQIYNTADTSVKCNIQDMIFSAIKRINSDGTGTIDFDDDFSTAKWPYSAQGYSNVTHDAINDEVDVADDGYIYYVISAAAPITGMPTLTSRINITTGTPTIQISTDASTWYDITTAIVDDVDTIYELDSSSLHLKGKTLFYWRIDCVKAGAATCTIKSFELDVNIVTIDFEHPVITSGGAASTFRCDQDASSGMNCTVALYYRGRGWPA